MLFIKKKKKKTILQKLIIFKIIFFFNLVKDMPIGDRYSQSKFDFLLNYVFQNYSRGMFDLQMWIWKSINFLEKYNNFMNYK